jgi:hypothetical protein
MKSGVKLSVCTLTLLCSLMATTISASSASAAFVLTTKECTGGEVFTLCYLSEGKLFALEGEETVTGTEATHEAGEERLMLVTMGGETVHIVCEKVTGTGTALQTAPLVTAPTLGGLVLTFTNCSLLPEGAGTKCELSAASAKEFKTVALAATIKTAEEGLVKPEAGTELGSATIVKKGTATCLAAGTKKITTTEGIVVLLLEPEVGLERHMIWVDEPAGLLVAEQPATILGAALGGFSALGDAWDLVLA